MAVLIAHRINNLSGTFRIAARAGTLFEYKLTCAYRILGERSEIVVAYGHGYGWIDVQLISLVLCTYHATVLHCDGGSAIVPSHLQRSKPVLIHVFHDLKWIKKKSRRLHKSSHSLPVDFAIQPSVCM